jgi:hypothetical protein
MTGTGGSNTSTKRYEVVPTILNNRQVLTNGTHSRYTANDNKNDNTAYLTTGRLSGYTAKHQKVHQMWYQTLRSST